MKALGVATLALLVSCLIGGAGALAASAQTEVARFAAATVTEDQGARVVVSNLTTPARDSNVPCHLQVTFYGSESAVINQERSCHSARRTKQNRPLSFGVTLDNFRTIRPCRMI
jgi:hypothetical protein